jgi:hypothetical protein
MGCRRLGLAPRQMLGQRELSSFLEDLAKTAHEELEVPIQLGWVERQNRRQDHRAASVPSRRFEGRFSGARRPLGKAGIDAQLMPESAFPFVATLQSVVACVQTSRCRSDGRFCSFFHHFLQERFRAGVIEKPASANRAPILGFWKLSAAWSLHSETGLVPTTCRNSSNSRETNRHSDCRG